MLFPAFVAAAFHWQLLGPPLRQSHHCIQGTVQRRMLVQKIRFHASPKHLGCLWMQGALRCHPSRYPRFEKTIPRK